MTLSRREALRITAAATLVAAVPAGAQTPALYREINYGDPKAKVTVTEFASLTCPACARFATEVLPEIKKNYIDTGKVRLVYVDFPTDNVAIAGAMLCRCVPPERGARLVETIFKNQNAWRSAKQPIDALRDFARLAGLSDAAFDACLADQALLKIIQDEQTKAQTQHKVRSTPTFVVGKEIVEGVKPYEDWVKILDAALKKAG